jgi:prepilin-type N-terminal cleavage/methylation domain-containing protein
MKRNLKPNRAPVKRNVRKYLSNRAGFTFIELMVALTIFSVIASTIYYALNAGINVYTKGDSIIAKNQATRVFFDTVARDVRNAVLYPNISSEWGEESIAFAAIVNVYRKERMTTRMVKIAYSFDPETGRVTRSSAGLSEGFRGEYAEKEIILEEVESLKFSYADKDSNLEEQYGWSGKSELEGKVPRGVKIKLTLKDKDELKAKKTTDKDESGAGEFESIIFVPMGKLGVISE